MKLIKIFTDGASRGNPGPGGWSSIIFYDGKVKEMGGFEDNSTNNRMEIKASIEALDFLSKLSLKKGQEVEINTDSRYLINGITKWIFNWKNNNWLTSSKEKVSNVDLWEELFRLSSQFEIRWNHVSGHSGIFFNERADEIATSFAVYREFDLFEGSFEDYKLKEFFIKNENSKRGIKKPYSYISEVDGKILTHRSWSDCEKRVKGVKGARFKKSLNPMDERKIIEEFQS